MSWQWRMIQKLKRNWLLALKLTWGIWRSLTRAFKSVKNCVLMGSLWPKDICLSYKITEELSFMTLKSDSKFEKKNELWFEKWHEKFGKFSTDHLKMSILELWWDPFARKRKCISLKFPELLCVIAMKNNVKSEHLKF